MYTYEITHKVSDGMHRTVSVDSNEPYVQAGFLQFDRDDENEESPVTVAMYRVDAIVSVEVAGYVQPK